ncbi:F-box/LRR-repeat protein 12-like isoform X1 [Thunnus albacares]|uniref:F-box/LRR-repeat protein 12-like isoform X1 n=1 Tax=Thunnus maccoyii TaxID=8240 RepID=UPI001C4CD693|nr:F-box/LRR-repeat protein 12-like isoform X1 [Thunnus maccoyii]XP_044219036.1 F-box/LRR-repeat protein 12-like isoform X1 [Thunnus albacares]|eukprot:superscaffoldBa00008433_g23346
MDEFKACNLDYCPENILIDVLSYLSVRELVRAGRVCKRWRRLVKDQRLWRLVDLTAWKGVTSRILWVLLRQFLGCGLRCLRLRGLLLSARGGTFLSESWLKALSTKCPRLSKLYLLHADLRSLPSCQLLPTSLQVLELRGCELPRGFFDQSLPTSPADPQERAEATSSVGAQQKGRDQKGKGSGSPSGISIERLVLNNVPSFTDQHLQSLTSWERLSRLELRDTFRVTANGLRSCAAKDGVCGVEGLFRLKFLEIGITGRQGYQLQMASLGLGAGWLGLEELSLGGKEVGPGLLCASRLKDLKCLCLWACTLSEMQIVRSCRMLRGLRRLEFLDVIFQPRQCPPVVEGEGGGEEEQDSEEAVGGDSSNDENKLDMNDPIPSLRRSLAVLLPCCALVFTNCSVQINAD